ncbi:MAG: hypothetical protein KGO96_07915 [Elusimicrobia bacterium]|nr:hypothetical protein [Elusimicrobiota bacterium]MDE2236844.1 hypothetical protein [Elusimicrobiota bacterium]MDE2425818.1 hypothetical protein [Elusimicrobiota bacterium]
MKLSRLPAVLTLLVCAAAWSAVRCRAAIAPETIERWTMELTDELGRQGFNEARPSLKTDRPSRILGGPNVASVHAVTDHQLRALFEALRADRSELTWMSGYTLEVVVDGGGGAYRDSIPYAGPSVPAAQAASVLRRLGGETISVYEPLAYVSGIYRFGERPASDSSLENPAGGWSLHQRMVAHPRAAQDFYLIRRYDGEAR